VADNNIDLTATFDASNATKGIKEFGKAAETSVDGVNKSMSGLESSIKNVSSKKLSIDTSAATSAVNSLKTTLKMAAAGIATYFSVQAISSFFGTMISESTDAQENLNQLNNALSRTGQLTTENSTSMSNFATAMMAVSTIDDDVINGQLAIALNFTKSTEQAQQLVKAAADLSAAMGVDLGTAVELLGRTLDGTAGRLNETVPALRGLSKEALQAGGAIKVIGEQFAGAAVGQISTYKGAIAQLGNVFGNFAAALGDMIVQNPMVTQAIKEISTALIGMTGNITDSTSASISFVNRGLLAIISGVRDLLPSLNLLSNLLESMALLFSTMWKAALNLVDGFKILGNAWLWLVGTISGKKSAFNDLSDAMDRINKRSDEIATSWNKLAKDGFDNIDTSGIDSALKRIQDAANKKPLEIKSKISVGNTPIPVGGTGSDTKTSTGGTATGTSIDTNEQPKTDEFFPFKTLEEFEKAEFLDPFLNWGRWLERDFFPGVTGGLGGFTAITMAIGEIAFAFKKAGTYLKSKIPDMLGGIQGLIAAISEGAEGAKTAIPNVLAGAVEGIGGAVGALWGPMGSAIGSGIGGIIGEQIKMAAQPVGDTMKAIDEFMEEVPKVIDKIVENLPTVMNKIFEKLPDLLIMILKALPDIMRASASAMKPLFKELGKESPSILQALLEILWESIAMIFMAIGYAIQGLAIGLWEMLQEKMAAFVADMEQFFGKIGTMWDTAIGWIREKINAISVANLVESINQFFVGIGNIFVKLWNDAATFFNWIFQAIGDLFLGFWDFLAAIPGYLWDGVVAIYNFFASIPKMLWDAIVFVWEFFVSIPQILADAIKGLVGIKTGGGGNTATSVLTGGLFATGGVVPKGYPDDSYPALLTSNEVVVPAQTAPNLFALIDKLSNGTAQPQNNQGSEETNSLLRQLITVITNQQTQVDVKLDRDTLAKAILSLNKDNRRLA